MYRSMLALAVAVIVGAPVVAQDASTPAQDAATLVRDGDFYMDRGDCALARYFYGEALGADPESAAASLGLGRALRCQGALAASIDAFRQAIALSDAPGDAYVQLALSYRAQYLSDPAAYASRLGDALDAVTEAERYLQNDATVLNTRGLILYQSNALEAARDAFERAASIVASDDALSDREKSTVRVNLGRTYRDLGDLERARTEFRRSVILDPTNPDAHNLLGNVHFRLGNCDEALYELGQAVTLAPSSLSAVSQLGIATFECGDAVAATPVLERAVDIDGAVFTPPLYTYLAQAYLEQGRVVEAVRRAQQGALLPPARAEAHYVLGLAYQARGADGDVEAARNAFETALDLRPDYAEARQALDALD